jgi:hypothetical protein
MVTYPEEITVAWLEQRHACASDVALFRRFFGDRVRMTRANLVRAARDGLGVVWLSVVLGCRDGVVQDQRFWASLQEVARLFEIAYGRPDEEFKRRCAQAYRDHRVLCATILADQLGFPEVSS